MKISPMELAALASAAVPGLRPTAVAALADDGRDFAAALVQDEQGNRWRVRSPLHAEAAMRLETELQVLSGFSNAVRASLPFHLPSAAGAVRINELRTFVYNHVSGQVLDLAALVDSGAGTAVDIGRSIAAIHNLDESVVDLVNLPSYSAEQFRQRRLNELDQAAATGKIPVSLLRRWEHAMEDTGMWSFEPVVVHGDLHEDHLLFERGKVSAVMGWTDLHVGDPADDFAWLATVADEDFKDQVLTAYEKERHGAADDHLSLRAALSAEFALAQWLLKGLATNDTEMVEQGQGMLEQLAEDIERYGGQEVSVTPMENESKTAEQVDDGNEAEESSAEAAQDSSAESTVETQDAPETPVNATTDVIDRESVAKLEAELAAEDQDGEPAIITDSDVEQDPAVDSVEDPEPAASESQSDVDAGSKDAETATDAIDIAELQRQQQSRLEQAREASGGQSSADGADERPDA
ncbi:phosphotransferase [Micrococcoides hystricis]|uniref:Phosphotransferase n=1 Tax=Micrococcoides hystricis TaxID=1572761 RepID=A0ABV6P8F6_9MICC